VVSALSASLAAVSGQAPISLQSSQRPTFEVVSVKRNNDPNVPTSIRTLPDRFTTTNAPFRLLINAAYRLAGYQYIGLPAWSDRFDIAARAPEGTPADQMPLMLQSLLADRFKMVAHRETREAPIFALVVSRRDRRLGPRLTKSTMDCAPVRAQRQAAAGTRGPAPIRVPSVAAGERPVCSARMIARPGSSGGVVNVYTAGNSTMQALADFLAGYVGQHVVDRTDLPGEFDFDLEFLPQQSLSLSPRAAASLDDAASVFTALQEQLGLKLESTRGPVEFLIIERVERPVDD
jgi:uncharacterized protein (TIGR03435 family)